jgi:Ca2+-binding RTX toxin-like protein
VVKNVEGIGTIRTGIGNDKLIIAAGSRDFTWWAGAGTDVLVADYRTAAAAITVRNAVSPDGPVTVITGAAMTAGFGGKAYGIEQMFITGTLYADTIQGIAGHDRLDGGAGADKLEGGKGNDTYVVENSKDAVIERDGEGTDTIVSARTWQLGDHVENLILTGSSALNGLGNALDNVITGNGARNILTGGDGNDKLDGGAGGDTLLGGKGNDSYYVDDALDIVQELEGQGTDTVYASISYSLSGRYVERLILTGGDAIEGRGNDLDNRIVGNSGDNRIVGERGNDLLWGKGGADRFAFGLNSGADKINDFDASEGDVIDLYAYHGKTVTITQAGADTLIDLGGGNTILVLNTIATNPAFLAQILV